MKKFNNKEILERSGEWLKGKGPDHEIVISSRIRLARNVADVKFVPLLNAAEAKKLVRRIVAAMEESNYLKNNYIVYPKELDDIHKQLLLERHLVSRELVESTFERAVTFSSDEIISIMINEEDHLRMQVMQSGFNLLETWRMINSIDTDLETSLSFAFDNTLGYLTACPTNVGTGLRASCMLHLPALVMTKQINKVLQAVAKLNLAVRGLYGEGTQASGNFFQFSNQVTLGKNEVQIVEDLEKVIKQIIEHEREARLALSKKKQSKLHDQIWRSVGTLKSARLISSQETNALLSLVRLGVDLKIVPQLDQKKLNELFIVTQPAHLQINAGRAISPEERDLMRAELVRRYLTSVEL